jgi:hypothetical protein
MASVPIVRYYDHLRFVYEVESRVRELRGDDVQGEGGAQEQQRKRAQPTAPGETKQDPGGKLEGPQTEPREGSGNPALVPVVDSSDELLETALEMQAGPTILGEAVLQGWERKNVWIA